MWSPGRSVSFPLPFSLSFSLRENQGRAGWVGSRGRRCHPASRVLRLPLPAPGADGPRSAFIAPPGTAGGGGGARSRGRGPVERAGPSGRGASDRDRRGGQGLNGLRSLQARRTACGKAGRELVPGYRRNVQEVGWSECLKGT